MGRSLAKGDIRRTRKKISYDLIILSQESLIMKNLLFAFCLVLFTVSLAAQQVPYHETKDHDYMAPMIEISPRQPGHSFRNESIFTTQVNVDINGNNIPNDAANEPSLGIDPTNPSRMVIGWRQFDNIASNFRQAGISVTMDQGESWLNLPPIEAGLFRSDPVLATDVNGRFYYNSLAENFDCDVFSSDNLTDWSDKTFAQGGDKQWMVIDNTDNASQGHIYAFWKDFLSVCPGGFTRSTDGNQSYEDCSFVSSGLQRGTMAIGPDGELYACGQLGPGFRVLRSDSARDPNTEVVWETEIATPMKGELAQRAGPNPSGMLGQVWIAVDHSENETRGNAYLLAPVSRSDNGDPADMMMSISRDGGQTWTEAFKIGADASTANWQWFGSVSVAPNGRVDVTWLDSRDNPGTVLSSLYYTFSTDGGETWADDRRLSEAFDPHLGWPQQNKIGDYFHVISDDEGAHLAWAATFNGEQDIYYSYITANPDVLSTRFPETTIATVALAPNPAKDLIQLTIQSELSQNINLLVYDLDGKPIHQENHKLITGEQQISLNCTEWIPGPYWITLESAKGQVSKKVMVVR